MELSIILFSITICIEINIVVLIMIALVFIKIYSMIKIVYNSLRTAMYKIYMFRQSFVEILYVEPSEVSSFSSIFTVVSSNFERICRRKISNTVSKKDESFKINNETAIKNTLGY